MAAQRRVSSPVFISCPHLLERIAFAGDQPVQQASQAILENRAAVPRGNQGAELPNHQEMETVPEWSGVFRLEIIIPATVLFQIPSADGACGAANLLNDTLKNSARLVQLAPLYFHTDSRINARCPRLPR